MKKPEKLYNFENFRRPAAEAWPLRVLQSQTWSQILLSYHGLQHPVGAAPDSKASASAAGPLALKSEGLYDSKIDEN